MKTCTLLANLILVTLVETLFGQNSSPAYYINFDKTPQPQTSRWTLWNDAALNMQGVSIKLDGGANKWNIRDHNDDAHQDGPLSPTGKRYPLELYPGMATFKSQKVSLEFSAEDKVPYTVYLHFYEPDVANDEDRRIRISVNNMVVDPALDITSETMNGKAGITVQTQVVPKSDGKQASILVDLLKLSRSQVVLSAIEVFPTGQWNPQPGTFGGMGKDKPQNAYGIRRLLQFGLPDLGSMTPFNKPDCTGLTAAECIVKTELNFQEVSMQSIRSRTYSPSPSFIRRDPQRNTDAGQTPFQMPTTTRRLTPEQRDQRNLRRQQQRQQRIAAERAAQQNNMPKKQSTPMRPPRTAQPKPLPTTSTTRQPAPSTTSVASTGSCVQVESCSGSQRSRFTLQRGVPGSTGCGILRWTNGNQYNAGRVGSADQVCFNVRIQAAGIYRVSITGIRNTRGRQPTGCNHKDKPGSLQQCRNRSGRPCVCNDEENDVWTKVNGRPVSVPGGAPNRWYKAMVDCPWDRMCEKARLNYNHKMFPSDYQFSAGSVANVCIAGRSTGTGVDKFCMKKVN